MLASGLFESTLILALPLQNHVVPVDQLGAAKVAENLGDFTALAANNGLGLFMVVGREPATELGTVAVADHHGVAALEAPFDSGHARRQQALARGQRLSRALIDGKDAPRL